MRVWIVEERAAASKGWRPCSWLCSDCFSSEQDAANALLTAAKLNVWAAKYDSVGPDPRRTSLGTCYRIYESNTKNVIARWRIRSLELR